MACITGNCVRRVKCCAGSSHCRAHSVTVFFFFFRWLFLFPDHSSMRLLICLQRYRAIWFAFYKCRKQNPQERGCMCVAAWAIVHLFLRTHFADKQAQSIYLQINLAFYIHKCATFAIFFSNVRSVITM